MPVRYHVEPLPGEFLGVEAKAQAITDMAELLKRQPLSPVAAEALGHITQTLGVIIPQIDTALTGKPAETGAHTDSEDLAVDRSRIDEIFQTWFENRVASYDGKPVPQKAEPEQAAPQAARTEANAAPATAEKPSGNLGRQAQRLGRLVCKPFKAAKQLYTETIQHVAEYFSDKPGLANRIAAIALAGPAVLTASASIHDAFTHITPHADLGSYTHKTPVPKNATPDQVAFAQATPHIDIQGFVRQETAAAKDDFTRLAIAGWGLGAAGTAGMAYVARRSRGRKPAGRTLGLSDLAPKQTADQAA